MSEKGAPQEECLYCHNSLAIVDRPCPVCGDTRKAQAQEPEEVPIFIVGFDPEFLPAYP
jgi:hypothetical protein